MARGSAERVPDEAVLTVLSICVCMSLVGRYG